MGKRAAIPAYSSSLKGSSGRNLRVTSTDKSRENHTSVMSACSQRALWLCFLLDSPAQSRAQPVKRYWHNLGLFTAKDDQDSPHRHTHKPIWSGYALFKTLFPNEPRLSHADSQNYPAQLAYTTMGSTMALPYTSITVFGLWFLLLSPFLLVPFLWNCPLIPSCHL